MDVLSPEVCGRVEQKYLLTSLGSISQRQFATLGLSSRAEVLPPIPPLWPNVARETNTLCHLQTINFHPHIPDSVFSLTVFGEGACLLRQVVCTSIFLDIIQVTISIVIMPGIK